MIAVSLEANASPSSTPASTPSPTLGPRTAPRLTATRLTSSVASRNTTNGGSPIARTMCSGTYELPQNSSAAATPPTGPAMTRTTPYSSTAADHRERTHRDPGLGQDRLGRRLALVLRW